MCLLKRKTIKLLALLLMKKQLLLLSTLHALLSHAYQLDFLQQKRTVQSKKGLF